jgi:hypothetical protein
MKMRTTLWILAPVVLALGFVAGGCEEEGIPLSDVPEKALVAARKAVPGIEIREAEVEKRSGGVVFEVEGTLDGVEYEITLSEEGEVLSVEQEGEEDDDGEDEGEEGEEEKDDD